MPDTVSLRKCSGRICIEFYARKLGEDLLVAITGGESHIGASAFCIPGEDPTAIPRMGHREGELACSIARRVANWTGRPTLVAAGIHYESITKEEIGVALELCDLLTAEFLAKMPKIAQEAVFTK